MGVSTQSTWGLTTMTMRQIFMAVFAVVLCASATQENVDGVVPESEFFESRVNQFAETLTESQTGKIVKEDDGIGTVKSIVELKAWCELAAQSEYFQNANARGENAIYDLVKRYSKKTKNDLVTQFALIIGKMRKKHNGMYGYIVDGINRNVLLGKTLFSNVKGVIVPSYANLGFQEAPKYFTKYAINPMAWFSAKESIHKSEAGKAVQMWIKDGTHDHYKKALAALVKKYADIEKAHDRVTQEAARAAIDHAFKEAKLDEKSTDDERRHVVVPLPKVGAKAVDAENAKRKATATFMQPPSFKQLEKLAMVQAEAAMQEAAHSADIARIIKDDEKRAEVSVK